MMNDLISRQAAIDAFWKLDVEIRPSVIDAIIEMLEQLPSAQPERKRGNWVGIDDEPCETFECDVCGFVLEDWIQGAFYNYCPHCGADMRGEQDE